MKVIIRPLAEKDAYTSFAWRNDPLIWKYAGHKPDRTITVEMELEWIRKVLSRPDEKRYAICVGEEMEYVGNVQLTDMTAEEAQFHIFIGNREYHGKGIGTQATRLILEKAFHEFGLKRVYLEVREQNIAAVTSYGNCGFEIVSKSSDTLTMAIVRP
jgi:diamine N-acetyltransferase